MNQELQETVLHLKTIGDTLTEEERLEALDLLNWCQHCGCVKNQSGICHCTNDE